jgi:hypothetical protein
VSRLRARSSSKTQDGLVGEGQWLASRAIRAMTGISLAPEDDPASTSCFDMIFPGDGKRPSSAGSGGCVARAARRPGRSEVGTDLADVRIGDRHVVQPRRASHARVALGVVARRAALVAETAAPRQQSRRCPARGGESELSYEVAPACPLAASSWRRKFVFRCRM